MSHEQLKLDNQLCFPFYAISRLITKQYQPFLKELEITYPQYLALMVLWETNNIPVNDIAKKLVLKTNTITPLLKRMEDQGLISRNKSPNDERKVLVSLTQKGKNLEIKALEIPETIAHNICGETLNFNDLIELREKLKKIADNLTE